MAEFDLVIRNSTIVDGTGKKAFNGSIGIKEDRVVTVGDVEGDSERVIDASGLTAVPGFIDSHSHADFMILFFPRCESFLLQGVTTFVGGQCGMSLAPVRDMMPLPGAARAYAHELEPYKYYPERTLYPQEQVNALMQEKFGWTVDWSTMGEYMNAVEKKGISCNYAPLVGHGAVRSYVLGEDYKRHSVAGERKQMRELIREAMDEGCIGMSVGLDYDPGVYASRDEIVELARIMNEYSGVFCPHSRRTGRRRNIAAGHRPHDKIDGILEVLDIIRKAGVRSNIAHLFTGWYVSPEGYPDILEEANRRATLQLIDDALEEGLDISFDVIPPALPMKFGGWQYLCGIFEPWLRELGSREAFGEWIKVRDFRDEVKDAIRSGKWWAPRGIPNPNTAPRWADNITILKHGDKENENRTIAEIAEEREVDQFETWLDLIADDPDSKCGVSRGTDPEAPYHSIFYQHPVSSVGLDTGVDDYMWEPDVPPWPIPGINNYSAYVGFFDKFVIRQKVLTLEEAVYKTSTIVAERHNLKGRGFIKEGGYADIVLMDLSNLKVMGTPLDTRIPPKGIEYVFVNGVPVVEKAKHTGATSGRVLRRE